MARAKQRQHRGNTLGAGYSTIPDDNLVCEKNPCSSLSSIQHTDIEFIAWYSFPSFCYNCYSAFLFSENLLLQLGGRLVPAPWFIRDILRYLLHTQVIFKSPGKEKKDSKRSQHRLSIEAHLEKIQPCKEKQRCTVGHCLSLHDNQTILSNFFIP